MKDTMMKVFKEVKSWFVKDHNVYYDEKGGYYYEKATLKEFIDHVILVSGLAK